ncbi:hypothetical protein OIU78_023135 [Salix suchowensis]|nr:hypothetical protein OIU78_023135 [Salix suchowensis]
MSLRSIGKEFFQSGSQRMQSVEDTAPENDSSVKSLKESARVSASSKQKRSFCSLSGFPYPELLTNATIFMGSMAPETHLNRLKFSDSCLALAW